MGKRTKSGGASAPPPPPPPPGGEGLFAGDSWHDWLPFYSEAKLLNKVFVTPALEHAQWLTTREAWEFLGARAYVLLLVDIPEQAKMFVNGVNWKLDDPTPKDIVIIFVLVYWVLKILYGLFSSVRKRIRGEANKGEVEGKAFRGPPLGFAGSNKKNALKESKKRKGRRTRSFLSRVWSKLKFFLFICGIQYCISGSGGMADMDMQFMKLLVAGQVRESAQAFINELLPKPTWQREPLLSWARLISVTYVLYYFFTNLMEQSDMLLYQDSVACVLFNTFDIGLDLLHLEMWLKWPMQLLFVAYWRFGNEHTLTFVLFANIFIVRIVSAITRYLGERMREPYSIVMPVIVGLPTLASFVYPFWIVNTFGANIKKMGVIHKKKQFILAKAIFNIRSSKSLYAILGVPEYSDAKVIKKAFRDASRTLHPDKNPDPKAQALFLKMQEAYNALKGGSVEQMRLQQRESNERDLNTLNDIMILGMMYAMSYFLFNVLLIFAKELWTYLSKKQGLRESNKAKNAYLQDEWERLLASQVTLETYIRTGKNRDIQDQATKWLHPLKRAIAFRAKNDFRRPYDEEELKERLGNLKRDLLGIKEKKVEPLDIAPAGPSDDGPSVQLPLPVHEAEEVGSSKMKKLEKSAIDKVCWGLVHRLRCLIHKRVLLTIYLEDVSKQDTDALEGIQKDLDDTIVSYTEEINKFAQLEAVDVAIDLDKHVENVDSYSRAIRYRFRKELRKGKEERLEWIKALLSGPWYEYEMHRYCAPTKY